jgi:hypothetical protein
MTAQNPQKFSLGPDPRDFSIRVYITKDRKFLSPVIVIVVELLLSKDAHHSMPQHHSGNESSADNPVSQ